MGGDNLKCIAPQCAEIKKFKDQVDQHYGGEHLPTMFIYMPIRDYHSDCANQPKHADYPLPKCSENLVPRIKASIAYLRRKGVKVAERVPEQWPVDKLLQARGYEEHTATKIAHALNNSKGDFGHKPMKKDYYIFDHPGDDWWKKAIRHLIVPRSADTLTKDHSALNQ